MLNKRRHTWERSLSVISRSPADVLILQKQWSWRGTLLAKVRKEPAGGSSEPGKGCCASSCHSLKVHRTSAAERLASVACGPHGPVLRDAQWIYQGSRKINGMKRVILPVFTTTQLVGGGGVLSFSVPKSFGLPEAEQM